jgi:sulfopyruvate decarboxylase subunit beta
MSTPRMPMPPTLGAIRSARRPGDVVITSMGTAREWMTGGIGALDFVYVPSSMGQASALGLGLALAQPDRRIIVCSGDGSLLMSLGSLVSIASAAPRNLTLVVFDNGVYEVTGAQPTPGAGIVDFESMARASGFGAVFRFTDLDRWERSAADVLYESGPTFIALDVDPVPGAPGPRSPGPAGARAKAFMAALR